MIGGKVLEVAPDRLPSGRDVFRIWALDPRTGDECAVWTSEDARCNLPLPGDNVWWQGKWIMWTPSDRSSNMTKARIPKVGYSFDPRNSL